MADSKISAFSDGGAIQDSDEFVIARASDNNKITGDKFTNKLDVASMTATGGVAGTDLMVTETSGGDLRKAQVGTDLVNAFYAPTGMTNTPTLVSGTDSFSFERAPGTLHYCDIDDISDYIAQDAVSFATENKTFGDSPYTPGPRELILYDCSGGASTVDLPTAASFPGTALIIKKVDSSINELTINSNGADTIDGESSKVLYSQYQTLILTSDGGTEWSVRNDGSFDDSIVGNPGFEQGGINIGGVTYDSVLKATDINNANLAQFILHKHSTTIAPVMVTARANSSTASHADVTNGMNLYAQYNVGWAGSSYKFFGATLVDADATGTISNTSSPGRMRFQVTADGSIAPTTWLTVTNDKKAVFAGAVEVANVPTNGDDVANKTYVDGQGFITASTTDTLTNKTINASSNTLSNITASEMDLTGTYDFSSGTLRAGTASAATDVVNFQTMQANVQSLYDISTIDNTDSPYNAGSFECLLCDTSSGNITIDLNAAADDNQGMIIIKKTASANTVTIDANGAETIDGAATQVISTQWESITIISDGSAWFIV